MECIIVLIFFLKIAASFDLMNPLNENKYFEIIPDRIECLLESPETGYWHLKVRKVNKTRAIFGYISFFKPMGDGIELDAKALKKQGGEYRYLPYRLPRLPFCPFCSEDDYIYKQFALDSDLPEDIENHCPLEPGNYTFYGAVFNPQRIPSTALQTGEYAFEWRFYKNDKVVAHYRIYSYVNNI
ncbi:hypothetical protein ACKWTF_011423 [Chironomus riparius]